MTITQWLETYITLHEHDDPREERANSLTHLLGSLLSLGTLIWLLFRFSDFHRPALAWASLVYVLSMFILYSASSLYHALPRGNGKRICRILDHSNIYFLIAGTYTPVLVYLNSARGLQLLGVVWAVAALGIVFTLVFWGRYGFLHVALYLAMGWMILLFRRDIIPFLPDDLLSWVLAGGITYSGGVIFYAMKKLPFYHAIWHLFVLAGSVLFFMGFVFHLFQV
jgi:hemolysin III